MLAAVGIVLATTLRTNAMFNIADVKHLFPPPRFAALSDDTSVYTGKVVPLSALPNKVIVATGKNGMHLMPLHEKDRRITHVYWSSNTCFDEKVKVMKTARDWYARIAANDAALTAELRDSEDYIAWMTATTPP